MKYYIATILTLILGVQLWLVYVVYNSNKAIYDYQTASYKVLSDLQIYGIKTR